MAGQTIQVSVLADTRNFRRAMGQLSEDSGLGKLAGVAKAAGAAVAVGIGAGVAGLGVLAKKGIDAASALQQSVGGVQSVFKEQAATVAEYSRKAAGDLGLSKNAYNELATIIGTTLKASGTPLSELAGKTNGLLTVSADLAATFGGPVTDASNAMASALRGEFEPMRRYGVSLSAAAIESRALADSGKATAKELTAQEKALATQALILESTADAQGAFARESNTLAGSTERLKAKWENISATLGTYLLPIITTVVSWIADRLEPTFNSLAGWISGTGVPAFRRLADLFKANILPTLRDVGGYLATMLPVWRDLAVTVGTNAVTAFREASTWIQDNRVWLEPLAVAVVTMVAGWRAYVTVMAAWKAATVAATAVQAAYNVVLAANPIGIIILAIAGLVAALVYFFTKTETGKRVWAELTAALAYGWELIKGAFSAGWSAVSSFMGQIWNLLKLVWNWSPYGLIINNWNAIWGFFAGIPGRITGFFGGAGAWLKDAGRNIVQGLMDGAGGLLGKLGKFFLDKLPSFIREPFKKALGIRSPSRLFAGFGANTVDGYVGGVSDNLAKLRASSRTMASTVADNFNPAMTASPANTGLGLAGRHYQVNVSALAATPEVGRVVVDAIRDYERLNGRDR